MENIVKRYVLSSTTIEVSFKKKNNKYILSNFKISPMYPYEAEILKNYIDEKLEWSYIDRENSVVFIPRDKELLYTNLKDFLYQIIEGLLFLKPKLARIFSHERIRERMIERGWLIWITENSLEARKYIDNSRVIVFLKKQNRFWYNGYISVQVHPSTRSITDDILKEIGNKYKYRILSKYPVFEIEILVHKIFSFEIEEFLDILLKILSRSEES